MNPASAPSNPKELSSVVHEAEALALRRAGTPMKEIARRLGITQQGAYQAVVRAYGRLKEQVLVEATYAFAQDIDRIDATLVSASEDLGSEDGIIRSRARRDIHAAIQRRAKMYGYDAPEQREVTIHVSEQQQATIAQLIQSAVADAGLDEQQRAAVLQATIRRLRELPGGSASDDAIEGEVVDG